jgi:hypothetical protein
MRQSQATKSPNPLKETSSKTTDVRVIATALIAVVGFIFFAGMYYRDAQGTIAEYRAKIDKMQLELAATSEELFQIRSSLNSAFSRLTTDVSNSGPPIINEEPLTNGGGAAPTEGPGRCPQGSFVVGIQPYKNSNSVRQIRFQCGKLPTIELK